jgi:hypothetical protein
MENTYTDLMRHMSDSVRVTLAWKTESLQDCRNQSLPKM